MVLHLLPFVLTLGGLAAPPQQTAPPVAPAAPVARVAQPAAQPKTYNETADAKAQIAAALEAAALDDIRVVVNWGANDDEGCAKFTQALRAPEIARSTIFSDEYKVVNVNVGHLDRNLDVARTYGAALASGKLPALTILDKTGKVLAEASAPEFSSATDPSALDPGRIAAFLAKYEAPAPDANAPFEAALNEAKRDGKSVMVWFSAPW